MAEKFPKDRFDVIPDDVQRVGAHRAPHQKGRGWIGFAWAAIATILLIGVGVFGLYLINGSIAFNGSPAGTPSPTVTSTPTPTITPTVNPKLNVTVLNGTTTAGLANQVGDALAAKGWKVASRANASQSNITTTVVYYSDPKNAGAALGAAQSLPGATTALTQDFVETGADLTVVVGSDYKAPGQ